MNSNAIFKKVKELIVDQLGVADSSVEMYTVIVEDLGADSTDIVDLILTLEEEFDVDITDDDAKELVTVEDIVEYIKENQD